jgi:hypothetical protein
MAHLDIREGDASSMNPATAVYKRLFTLMLLKYLAIWGIRKLLERNLSDR